MKTLKSWVRQNRNELIWLGIILVIGAVMRFWRIGEYMTFLGDEGRDAIIVRRLLVDFDPILIGPGTSIGNMYIGPLYYYLIAPALLLANFSPVGPSMLIALIGVVTIGMVWWIGRSWFGKSGALLAAFLYAISPTVIIFSRASWNPNVMPFFALLMMYAIWMVWEEKKLWWLAMASVCFAFVLQSHWIGLLLGPLAGVYWLLTLRDEKWGGSVKRFVCISAVSLGIFLVLMSPLLIFDMRHGWINFTNMKTFFTVRQTTVSARPWNAVPQMWPLFIQVITRLVAGRNVLVGQWAAVGLAGILVWLWGQKKAVFESKQRKAFVILILWMFFGLVGLGVYKQHIYDHYFGFLFPVPYLILAGMIEYLLRQKGLRGTWIVVTAMVILVWANLTDNPLRNPPAGQLDRTVKIARLIEKESGGEKFNLAVIAERNYEDAYQYFLENWNTKVIDIDPVNTEETITDNLFVVCEKLTTECDPTHNPKAEVANFGWSQVGDTWEVDGVTIYKLVHYENE